MYWYSPLPELVPMFRTPEPLLDLTEVPPRTSKVLVGLEVPIPTFPLDLATYNEAEFVVSKLGATKKPDCVDDVT